MTDLDRRAQEWLGDFIDRAKDCAKGNWSASIDEKASLAALLSEVRREAMESTARMLKMTPDEIRLIAGECTAPELRLATAMLANLAAAIRAAATEGMR